MPVSYTHLYIAEKKQWNVIQTYDAKMNTASKEEIEKEWKKAKIYNENLIGQPVQDVYKRQVMCL